MIKIELTPQQVEELTSFYVLELDKIQKRANDISELIAKLGANPITLEETTAIKVEKRAYVKKDKAANLLPSTEVKKPKRARRKSRKAKSTIIADDKSAPKNKYNYTAFINETLAKQNHILTAKELTLLAVKQYEIPTAEVRMSRNNISSVLSRLAKGGKYLKAIQIENVVGKSYGLTTWFDENGQLISEYK